MRHLPAIVALVACAPAVQREAPRLRSLSGEPARFHKPVQIQVGWHRYAERAVVDDGEMQRFIPILAIHANGAIPRELDGIADQIGQYLTQSNCVTSDCHRNICRDKYIEFQTFEKCRPGQDNTGIFNGLAQIEIDIFQK